MKNIVIIPARGGSKRLKNKNVKFLHNKPMIAYTIEAAKLSNVSNYIVVSTDDEEIKKVAIEYGADVPFLRPNELANDTASSIDVIKHTIEFYKNEKGLEFENIILLQPTSPLRNSSHIAEAYNLFNNNNRIPVLSVKEINLTNKYFNKISEKSAKLNEAVQTGFELNGAIYITTIDEVKNNRLYNEIMTPYLMDDESSIDIDYLIDFKMAEFILEGMN